MRVLIGKFARHPRLAIAVALVALGVAVVVWASVNEPGPTPFLELDGNIGFDALAGASFDWANAGANTGNCAPDPADANKIKCTGTGGLFDGGIFNGSTTPPTPPAFIASDPTIVAASFGADPLSVDVTACGLGDPTVYTGAGGETNGDDLNTETFSTGSVPNKDEISNAYAIARQDLGDPSTPLDDTFEVFAGFERVVNNGDSHVDLEFLQQPVTLSGTCAGHFQGHRSQGDMLLSVDFTKGGAVGNPTLHRWVCSTPQPTGTICDPNKAKDTPHYELVTDADTQAAVRQIFNAAAPVGCGGWACRNANGTETSTVNTAEFYEVGIDLAKLGFEGCISTFLPHTRSSQSFTATLKDFEIIEFNTCQPSTILTKTASATVVTVGDTVTYTYVEKNDGNVALTDPFVEDDTCSPVTYVSGDTNNDGILDPGESWTFTCHSDPILAETTNTAIGHATFTILNTQKDVTFCQDPTNPPPDTVCDQDERAQATVTVKTPSTTLNKSATATVVTTVNYTYAETNDGQVPLTPPVPGNRSSLVTDPACVTGGGVVVYTAGDTNNNLILDPGETWAFACTATFNGPGAFSNVATGHGIDNLGRDVTTCPAGTPTTGKFCDADETDTNTVTVSVTVNNGK